MMEFPLVLLKKLRNFQSVCKDSGVAFTEENDRGIYWRFKFKLYLKRLFCTCNCFKTVHGQFVEKPINIHFNVSVPIHHISLHTAPLALISLEVQVLLSVVQIFIRAFFFFYTHIRMTLCKDITAELQNSRQHFTLSDLGPHLL